MKLFKLFKVEVSAILNIGKIFRKNSLSEKMSIIIKDVLILALMIYFGYFIYLFADSTMEGFVALNTPDVLIAEFFALGSVFVVFMGMFQVEGSLYKNKDFDLLYAMPIKKETIVTSKIAVLYVNNLLMMLLLMIPAYLVYVKYVEVSMAFSVMYFVSLLFVPIVPLVVAILVGSLVIGITSRLPFKKILRTLMLLGITIGALYFSISANYMDSIDMVSLSKSIVDIFNRIYPLTSVYVDMLVNSNWLVFVLFAVISVGLLYGFIKVISIFYAKLVSSLVAKELKKNNTLKIGVKKSSLWTLIKKELKKFITSPTYLLNCGLGIILMPVLVVIICFFDISNMEFLSGFGSVESILMNKGPLLIGMLILLSCTTHSAISLEGNKLWIVKSMPVLEYELFAAKALCNIIVVLPMAILCSIVLCVVYNLGVGMLLLYILSAIIYSFFVSLMGLVINITFPKFDWQNEVVVIKQSMAAFLAVFVNMIIGVVALIIETRMASTLYILVICSILLVVSVLMVVYLMTVGKKILVKL